MASPALEHTAMPGERGDVGARRLWLPWRPRFRLLMLYPRCWHWVVVQADRFDVWFGNRIARWPLRRLWVAVVFPFWVAARFLGLVAVLEITIVGLAASLYLLYGEWLLLLVLFPFVLLARLAHALPWRLAARDGELRWTTGISGWPGSRQALTIARDALAAGREPPATGWTAATRRSWVWR